MSASANSPVYDDRSQPAFPAFQTAQKEKLTLFVGAMFLALGVVLVTVWTRGIDLSSPRDWLLIALLPVVASLAILGLTILPRSRHYEILNGWLEYPRWGGIRRGRLSLESVDAFRREGRDPQAASIILLSAGRQVFLLPEDLLASPQDFIQALRFLGLKELSPRFRGLEARD